MSKNDDALRCCPFCGSAPKTMARPDNIDGTEFFAAVFCHCGGYSARAHCGARRPTQNEAEAAARAAWNRRPENEAQAALLRQAEKDMAEVKRIASSVGYAKAACWYAVRDTYAAIRQHLEGKATKCEHCNGRGHIEQARRSREGDEDVTEACCPRCHGDGTIQG